MYSAIFSYIDRIFSVVRPRKLLFMAIDGPAPRAKMNQQRTRRFKAAKERADNTAEAAALRSELKAAGRTPPPVSDKPKFDSNVITPGTQFMDKLAQWLRYYVQMRLHSDPGWANIKVPLPDTSLGHVAPPPHPLWLGGATCQVILSDASVPGEGEHKIMEHIRQQRCLPGYVPDTRHVIHGLDADLIMLALATHEPHVRTRTGPNKAAPRDPCHVAPMLTRRAFAPSCVLTAVLHPSRGCARSQGPGEAAAADQDG